MKTSIDQALSAAVLTLLQPLVKILLRNGIAYGAFAELARKVYVDVAFRDHGLPGKKQTVSRVSALTGLTRKEAKRLLEQTHPDNQGTNERYNRAIRVISGWLHDPRFCDTRGNPLTLPVDQGNPSFPLLVKDYSGDIPTRAMLLTLSEAGSVALHGDQVHLINHAYIPGSDPVDKLTILGTDAGELMATIDHNLTAGELQLHFQRKVSNNQVVSTAIPAFKRLAARRSQALLEDLDHWLAQHEPEIKPGEEPPQTQYVSVGIYYYQADPDEPDET